MVRIFLATRNLEHDSRTVFFLLSRGLLVFVTLDVIEILIGINIERYHDDFRRCEMLGSMAPAMSAFIVLVLSSSLAALNAAIRWRLGVVAESAFDGDDGGRVVADEEAWAVFGAGAVGANIIFLMFWKGVSKRSVSSMAVSTMKKYSWMLSCYGSMGG